MLSPLDGCCWCCCCFRWSLAAAANSKLLWNDGDFGIPSPWPTNSRQLLVLILPVPVVAVVADNDDDDDEPATDAVVWPVAASSIAAPMTIAWGSRCFVALCAYKKVQRRDTDLKNQAYTEHALQSKANSTQQDRTEHNERPLTTTHRSLRSYNARAVCKIDFQVLRYCRHRCCHCLTATKKRNYAHTRTRRIYSMCLYVNIKNGAYTHSQRNSSHLLTQHTSRSTSTAHTISKNCVHYVLGVDVLHKRYVRTLAGWICRIYMCIWLCWASNG